MALNHAFWRGRGVFLTGHTGFKGAWLAQWLLELGAKVSGYALAPTTDPALFDQLGLARALVHHVADVRDAVTLKQAIAAAQPEVVFHLAAQPLVRQSYADPLETYGVNVMGTANLLEACRELDGLRAVVVVTTDKCYENREWHWGYREIDRLGGHDPYSNSKACAELVTDAYRRSFFGAPGRAHVGSARAGNVIGGGDWAADRLVPDAMRAFSANRRVTIRYPGATRPWQHVLEPLHGYLLLAEALCSDDGRRYAEAWNFGPRDGDAQPVRVVIDALSRLWPGSPGWSQEAAPQPHEAGQLKLDCSKAHVRLHWQPTLLLEQSLALTVDWYRAVMAGGDAAALTRRHIANYMTLIQTKE